MNAENEEGSEFLLSLVVPVYFEEECIAKFIEEATYELGLLNVRYEIVFVDDGSLDKTCEIIRAHAKENTAIKLVELSYNHGKAFAFSAGVAHASGDYLLYMDPDLQDPPDEIKNFLAKIQEGYDLVFGLREVKKDTLSNRLTSRLFWFILDVFTGLDLPRPLAVMRIFNRRFANKFMEYGESTRFIEGMFRHIGMRQTSILVSQRERYAGKSKFDLNKKLKLAFNAIFDYSELPLQLAIRFGVFLIVLGVMSGLTVIFLRLFVYDFWLGWPSLFVSVVFGFGVQLFFLGLIGRYVGTIYKEVKGRPLYSVADTVNL